MTTKQQADAAETTLRRILTCYDMEPDLSVFLPKLDELRTYITQLEQRVAVLTECLDRCAKRLRHITQRSDEIRNGGKPRSNDAEYHYLMCVDAAARAEAALAQQKGG